MTDRELHIGWAADALKRFQENCGTDDSHAIADLICDLGHLADQRSLSFLDEVRRGMRHWHAERQSQNTSLLTSDAEVKITIRPARQRLRARG